MRVPVGPPRRNIKNNKLITYHRLKILPLKPVALSKPPVVSVRTLIGAAHALGRDGAPTTLLFMSREENIYTSFFSVRVFEFLFFLFLFLLRCAVFLELRVCEKQR
jgi:hypothetical protein